MPPLHHMTRWVSGVRMTGASKAPTLNRQLLKAKGQRVYRQWNWDPP